MSLIDCDEVSRRKELHISHSDLLEVVDTCCKAVRVLCSLLSESKILTLVSHARGLVDREIPMVHLINDDVRRLDLRALVLCPSFRICLVPIYHCASPAVHSDCLRSDAGSLLEPLAVLLDLECIECALYILLYSRLPESVLSESHIDCLERCLIRSGVVKLELSVVSIRCPHCKFCLVALVHALLESCGRDCKCAV